MSAIRRELFHKSYSKRQKALQELAEKRHLSEQTNWNSIIKRLSLSPSVSWTGIGSYGITNTVAKWIWFGNGNWVWFLNCYDGCYFNKVDLLKYQPQKQIYKSRLVSSSRFHILCSFQSSDSYLKLLLTKLELTGLPDNKFINIHINDIYCL